MKERIVVAYSGAVDSSAAIPVLVDTYRAEIAAMILDLGQGQDLEETHARALAAGAARAHVLDVREEFARDFVLPALHAGALYDGRDPMAIPLARPLLGKKLVEIAVIEGATAVAHGCAGADRARVDGSVAALNADLRVLPAIATAVPTPTIRTNLWGRMIEYDAVEDPSAAPPESWYSWTKSPSTALDAPAHVEISFEQGVPTAINGVPLAITELIESLSIIAGQHGVGRITPTNKGLHSGGPRQIHEVPAATVLHAAHKALERVVVSPQLAQLKDELSARYAGLVWSGLWFTPVREALDAFNAAVEKHVTGSVRMTLLKGDFTLVECRSAFAGGIGEDLQSPIPDPRSPRMVVPRS